MRSETDDPGWLKPQWPGGVDLPGVSALMSTRCGGVSQAPFDSLNLAVTVGDSAEVVRKNRALFAAQMPAQPVYLQQVHGQRVVQLTGSHALPQATGEAALLQADASVTTARGVACTVQVADCLPVLFAALEGQAVAAAHAGWRGLAGGVLQATLAHVCKLAHCEPAQVAVWLGPCIGPTQFEVGQEVMQGFGVRPAQDAPHFLPLTQKPGEPPKWLCNLVGLARRQLHQAGVQHISGGHWCTVNEPLRFFSFRRDRVTGRMAAAIWIE
jgi:polyphenol oxidase